jgi:hypothetical protein
MDQNPEQDTPDRLGALGAARMAQSGYPIGMWLLMQPVPERRGIQEDHEIALEAVQEGRLIPNSRTNPHD